MYKKANHNEQFSELFVAMLGCALGFRMAHYERGEGCVRSEDFTGGAKVNFEPALGFMGDNEDYEAVIASLEKLCPQAIPDYIRMIFMDTVTGNPDRHTGNFGLLREPDTGALLGLAPMFDHNMALIARGYPSAPTEKDWLIRLFNELLEAHPDYGAFLPVLTEETVRGVTEQLGMKVRTRAVIDWVMQRQALIQRQTERRTKK